MDAMRVYRWPAGEKRPGQVLGVVTRWGGENDTATGYLIGAGSRIGEKVYRAHRGDDGDPLAIVDLPPAWIAAALAADTAARPVRAGTNGAADKVAEGHRHGYLRDQARHLRGLGLTGSALFDAVSALNLERCDPPKAAEDVARAIGDAELRFPADSLEGYGPDGVDVTSPVRDAIGSTEPPAWPDPPAEAAYHGVLGAIAPGRGAANGGRSGRRVGHAARDVRRRLWRVARSLYQGSMQRTNLSILLVGETGFRGRKGTASMWPGASTDWPIRRWTPCGSSAWHRARRSPATWARPTTVERGGRSRTGYSSSNPSSGAS